MATQANLTVSSLRRVNIYKCRSNGASDIDFLLPAQERIRGHFQTKISVIMTLKGWFEVHAKISVMALTPSPLSVIMTLIF